MANNKYIGHNGQLIGPVSDRFLNPSKEINYSFYGEKKEFYNHLSSLPSIPCEGWTPEDGKVYLDGVDFAKQHQYYNGDDWRNCGLEFFISFNLHKNSSFGRIVAVPLTPAPADPDYELNPEEGAAYLTHASTTEQAEGLYTKEQQDYVNSVKSEDLRAHLLHQVRLRDNMEKDRDAFEKAAGAWPSVAKAVERITYEMNQDKSPGSYYHSWLANIVMAFKDEWNRWEKPECYVHEVANNAAEKFLDSLCSKQSQPAPAEQAEGDDGNSVLPKCTLTNDELVKRVKNWVSRLCETGGRAWKLKVPVDVDNDPDCLITELCNRLKQNTYPAEFVEPPSDFTLWVVVNRWQYDHVQHKWYNTFIGQMEGKVFSHTELFQYWKTIQSKSK